MCKVKNFMRKISVSFVFSPKQFLANGFVKTEIIWMNQQNLKMRFP